MKKLETVMDLERCVGLAQAIRGEIRRAVIGQQEVIDQILVGLLAGGHVLIEGLPGLGKTLLVRALARTFGGQSARIQFTPDLMPSDILGHSIYNMHTQKFEVRFGPVFTNLLIADEINRAPAKTQAALLEAMQERQVTIEGSTYELPPPFMTLATQNPFEHEGTYPLPDAQLDRFLLKVLIGYPEEEEEGDMVEQVTSGAVADGLMVAAVKQVAEAADIIALQDAVARVHVDRRVIDYAVQLVRATRTWPGLTQGAGPRGSLALVRAGRARALLLGRDFVLPDDVKAVALSALRHRVTLSPDLELEGGNTSQLLPAVFESVQAPRL